MRALKKKWKHWQFPCAPENAEVKNSAGNKSAIELMFFNRNQQLLCCFVIELMQHNVREG